MDVSVSPFFTVIFVAVRAEETDAGRKICEPALIWFASLIVGLTESSSCQRVPLPKFCSAIFQSESPGFAITARRRRAERRAKATARRQRLPIFPRATEQSDFSSPPPERDLRASESAHALDPARCRHAWIFSAYFAFEYVPDELLR